MTDYKALTGLNYISTETGEETRVEAGDKIVGMGHDSIRHELEAGNIEPVSQTRKKKTEKVEEVESGGDSSVQPESRIEG
ncbi:hypothetical protein [Streptomyces sp. NPDC006477]|uniref:hypothetical protein n=1 Tax=Streptomyces sp. NPDC006477 TaxID=3364747 RepID=UPI00368CB47B